MSVTAETFAAAIKEADRLYNEAQALFAQGHRLIADGHDKLVQSARIRDEAQAAMAAVSLKMMEKGEQMMAADAPLKEPEKPGKPS